VNSAQAPKADLVSGTASGAARKGIIAAGIQEHDLVPGRSDRLKDCLKLDRASGRAALAAISHVCRREDVSAGEVHAVASIEDDGVIGTLRFGLEVIQRCMKLRVGEILFSITLKPCCRRSAETFPAQGTFLYRLSITLPSSRVMRIMCSGRKVKPDSQREVSQFVILGAYRAWQKRARRRGTKDECFQWITKTAVPAIGTE